MDFVAERTVRNYFLCIECSPINVNFYRKCTMKNCQKPFCLNQPGFDSIFSMTSLATSGFLSRTSPSVFPRSKQVKSTSSFCSLTILARISSRPTVSSVTPLNLTMRSSAPSSRLSSPLCSFFTRPELINSNFEGYFQKSALTLTRG